MTKIVHAPSGGSGQHRDIPCEGGAALIVNVDVERGFVAPQVGPHGRSVVVVKLIGFEVIEGYLLGLGLRKGWLGGDAYARRVLPVDRDDLLLRVEVHDQLLAENGYAFVDLWHTDIGEAKLEVGLHSAWAEVAGDSVEAEKRPVLIEEAACYGKRVTFLGCGGGVRDADRLLVAGEEARNTGDSVPRRFKGAACTSIESIEGRQGNLHVTCLRGGDRLDAAGGGEAAQVEVHLGVARVWGEGHQRA